MDTQWLLDRAMALLHVLMRDREASRFRLVNLPPGGASLEAIERDALMRALERTEGVQKEAAKLLRISKRVMNYKVRQHDLPVGRGRYGSRKGPTVRRGSAGE